MDSWNTHGRTRDMTLPVTAPPSSTTTPGTRRQSRDGLVHGDAEPEKGFYYRSDHFNFAKQGVPALDIAGGVEYLGKPRNSATGAQGMDDKRYHTPLDVVLPDWDLKRDARGPARTVSPSANAWRKADRCRTGSPGTSFKAKRDAMLKMVKATTKTRRRTKKA